MTVARPSLRGALATKQSSLSRPALRASGLLRTSCGASRRTLARNDATFTYPQDDGFRISRRGGLTFSHDDGLLGQSAIAQERRTRCKNLTKSMRSVMRP